MTNLQRQRLDATLSAVCPILGTSGEQGSITISFDPAATKGQITDAGTALAGYDYSPQAQAAWEAQQAAVAAKAALFSPSAPADLKPLWAAIQDLYAQVHSLQKAAGVPVVDGDALVAALQATVDAGVAVPGKV